MEPGTLLLLLLLLACPLLMVFMHRGGHGGHASHGAEGGHAHGVSEQPDGSSLEELRRRRSQLDAQIAQLEQAEAESDEPVAVGGR